jgi:hypothetical protein
MFVCLDQWQRAEISSCCERKSGVQNLVRGQHLLSRWHDYFVRTMEKYVKVKGEYLEKQESLTSLLCIFLLLKVQVNVEHLCTKLHGVTFQKAVIFIDDTRCYKLDMKYYLYVKNYEQNNTNP